MARFGLLFALHLTTAVLASCTHGRSIDTSPSANLTPQGTPLTWRSDLSTTVPPARTVPTPRPPPDPFERQLDDIAAHPPSITAEQAQQFRKEAENSIDTKLWRYCSERFPVDFAAQKWCIDDQFDGLRQVIEFIERYNTTP